LTVTLHESELICPIGPEPLVLRQRVYGLQIPEIFVACENGTNKQDFLSLDFVSFERLRRR
jgi:hypothetical protein